MRRVLPLISGALIALGATLCIPSLSAASFAGDGGSSPDPCATRCKTEVDGFQEPDGLRTRAIGIYRDGVRLVVAGYRMGSNLAAVNYTAATLHLRIDFGSGPVKDLPVTPHGAGAWVAPAIPRKFRIVLGSYATGWVGPYLGWLI